jgi:hypothetical protein
VAYDRGPQLGVLASTACGSDAFNIAQRTKGRVKGVLSFTPTGQDDEGVTLSEPCKLERR